MNMASTRAPENARDAADCNGEVRVRFSICTLVTDWHEYADMVDSCRARGFLPPLTEFLYLDNSDGNRFDAYQGINRFVGAAQGRYLIICHQDIVLHDHGLEQLDRCLRQLDELDPAWALAGNAGGVAIRQVAKRISDPHGSNVSTGVFPQRVHSLDENFLVLRASASIICSHDLHGFHFYGSDLCQIAEILGRHAYVIDFHLHHKSPGVAGSDLTTGAPDFRAARDRFMQKYQRAFSPRWIQTTCTRFFISGSGPLNRLMNSTAGRKLALAWHKRRKH